jgi:exportin-1
MDQVAASLVKQFDISVLDQLVSTAYDPTNPQRGAANKALMQLQEAPELWTKADEMIEKSSNPHTRFFGLQRPCTDAIKTRYVLCCVSRKCSLCSNEVQQGHFPRRGEPEASTSR